jgi:hypothetical protein
MAERPVVSWIIFRFAGNKKALAVYVCRHAVHIAFSAQRNCFGELQKAGHVHHRKLW